MKTVNWLFTENFRALEINDNKYLDKGQIQREMRRKKESEKKKT